MKILRRALSTAIIPLCLCAMISCDTNQITDLDEDLVTGSYGAPHKIDYTQYPLDQLWVAFGVITDTHVDASYAGEAPSSDWPFYDYRWRDTDRVLKNRKVIDALKSVGVDAGAHFHVHLGDLVDDNNTQNLVSWRQHWEFDYPGSDGGYISGAPGDHDAYSQGHKINKPVFPTLGNHDTPPFSDGTEDWNEVAGYIRARVRDANDVSDYFGYGAYTLRVGQYYFIFLGEWAGAGRDEGQQSEAKLDWLEDYLAEHVGKSNLGVLVFQHYGWDDFSTGQDGNTRVWWNAQQRQRELDILRPYNVLGIFTGHSHGRRQISVYAGVENGQDVYFDNYVTDDAAGSGRYGFSIVTLKGAQQQMEIKEYSVGDGSGVFDTYTKPVTLGLPTPQPCPGTPTVLYEGKTYHTVQIGDQCWFKENLNMGTMVDGSVEMSQNYRGEKYCYNNNEANCDIYGGLYQWGEAMAYGTNGSRGLCPSGWHVPTYDDHHTLGRTSGWIGNNWKATDQGSGEGAGTDRTGFSALLSGYRARDGSFQMLNTEDKFFSSTEDGADKAWRISLYADNYSISHISNYKNYGFSIRCVKDQ